MTEASAGHNSVNTESKKELASLIRRIETLEDEKKTIAEDIKEVFAEAKAKGFDSAIIRKALAVRKKGVKEYKQEQSLLELYLDAIGVL